MKEYLFIKHGKDEEDEKISIPEYAFILNRQKKAIISEYSIFFEPTPSKHYEQIVLLSNTSLEERRRNLIFFSIFSQN